MLWTNKKDPFGNLMCGQGFPFVTLHLEAYVFTLCLDSLSASNQHQYSYPSELRSNLLQAELGFATSILTPHDNHAPN